MNHASPVILSILLAWIGFVGTSQSTRAVDIRRGDILVADPDFVHLHFGNDFDSEEYQPTLWKVDPVTGVREVVTSKSVGNGAPLLTVNGVVVDRAGRITIADGYSGALMRVDPTTGDRSYFSMGGDGNSDPMNAVTALTVDRDDSLIVLDHLRQNILRVDPVTGHRTIISGPAHGSGPLYPYQPTISVDRSGNIWTGVYADYEDVYQSAIMRIDAVTGERAIVSGFGVADGPLLFADFHDILNFDADSAIVTSQNELFHIDLNSGNRSVLETDGPWINKLYTVAKADDGTLYLGDEYDGNVHRLDLNTGVYQLLSGNTPDWGPRMWMPQDMFVVLPEPLSLLLILLAMAMVGRCRLDCR